MALFVYVLLECSLLERNSHLSGKLVVMCYVTLPDSVHSTSFIVCCALNYSSSYGELKLDQDAQVALNNRSVYSVHCVILCGVRPRKLHVKGGDTKCS